MNLTNPIGIVGAKTLGTGIAQAITTAGWTVRLFDFEPTLLELSMSAITNRFHRLVAKGRISDIQASNFLEQIATTNVLNDLNDCDLIIEAVEDDFDTKTFALKQIGNCSKESIIATSTTLLSITELGEACGYCERIVGMHFFNPAPITPLVEIVRGNNSSESAIQRATLLAEAWGKTVVHCEDTSGFIVNRISQPFYLESWRIVEEGIATINFVDETLQTFGEFKMGPFILSDLIGQDVLAQTTVKIWNQLGKPNRLMPSERQTSLVEKGHFGRITGCGAYAHDDKKNTVPAILIETQELELSNRLEHAINDFCIEATCTSGSMLEKYIFSRVLASIINEAMWVSSDEITSSKDIDIAMKLAANYPLGPIEWANRIGMDRVLNLLAVLNETTQDGRFASPPLGTVPAS